MAQLFYINCVLKGVKGEVYEGGIRTPAFIHAPNIMSNSG
jgi:arylsulfatase A-like enzyme